MKKWLILHMILSLAMPRPLHSQAIDSVMLGEQISVLSRVSKDSVTLRWAPRTVQTWQDGNSMGFQIERFTVVRGNEVLALPERLILISSLRPAQFDDWESLVKNDKYAAIAAQAIFGEDFTIDLDQADIVSIANKASENEQRFGFALLAADMSPATARKCGLWFSDTTAKTDEKYLYRICLKGDSTQRGSAFVEMQSQFDLPKPKDFEVEVSDKYVNLRWRQLDLPFFTWYKIERSEDSVHYHDVADVPTMTLSPREFEKTKFHYATDTVLHLDQVYHYRIRGVTPFGDVGPASKFLLRYVNRSLLVPYVTSAMSTEDKEISISWDFSGTQDDVRGFIVERASADRGPYVNLTSQSPLSPLSREFVDTHPEQVNYYRVACITHEGNRHVSPSLLATLTDSIPPAVPTMLKGSINPDGVVNLTWARNSENDILGYRIYKSNHPSEEPFQLTSRPVIVNQFLDTIPLKTLNRAVYYSVIAVDRQQNNSHQSSIFKLLLPDKVSPAPPTMLPVLFEGTDAKIRWVRSSSEDVQSYDVYRAEQKGNLWTRLKIVQATSDSVLVFTDMPVPGAKYKYTVVAIDSSENESKMAKAVSAGPILKKILEPVVWNKPVINSTSRTVMLSWRYSTPNVSLFRIFKAVDNEPFSAYRTISAHVGEFEDSLRPGQTSRYRIIAVFQDGYKSHLSEEIKITF